MASKELKESPRSSSTQSASSTKVAQPVKKIESKSGIKWADDDDNDIPPHVNEIKNTSAKTNVEVKKKFNWADASDEEYSVNVKEDVNSENEETDSDIDSEEEEEEEEDSEPDQPNISQPVAPIEKKSIERTLSKKERKRLEMDELEAALAEIGIDSQNKEKVPVEKTTNNVANSIEVSESTSSGKVKKKKKKVSKQKHNDEDIENVEVVPITQVLQSKITKKKTTKEAVRLAQEEAKQKTATAKKKKSRNKSAYNEMPSK